MASGFADRLPAMFDPTDRDLRESLAAEAYYRERQADAAADQEHCLDPDAQYLALAWESLDSFAQRPFRMGVDVAMDRVAEAIDA